MKKSKICFIGLMLLSIIISAISLAFLSDIIPIHFGIDGKPDQFGTKYFVLIFSGISILIGSVMLIVEKFGKLTDNYKKYLILTGNILLFMFNAIIIFFVIYALNYSKEVTNFQTSKFILPLIGTLFIIMGNFMPKIEKNNTLGFKTKWSKYSDTTWQKTHRFAGFLAVIMGLLVIILSIFFKDIVNFIIFFILLTAYMIITTVASYKYYKQELNENN